eukprot:jgi/Picsp_1/964/NSC_04448-R1_related to diaphanous protein homolog 1
MREGSTVGDKENSYLYSSSSRLTGVQNSYVGQLQQRKASAAKGKVGPAGPYALKLQKQSPLGAVDAKNSIEHRLGNAGSYAKTSGVRNSMIPASIDLATDEMQQQLDAYDQRLTSLRNQLQASVDEQLIKSRKKKISEEVPKSADSDGVCILQGVVTSTGQGCKEVVKISSHASKNTTQQIWKSRPFKSNVTQSSCTLKLSSKESSDVTIRLTFADGNGVPSSLLFEHAPKATSAFKVLGKVSLQKKSMKQLKHVFRLGKEVLVDRFLRITCSGHVCPADAKGGKAPYHAVSYLNVTGTSLGDEDEHSGSRSSSSAGSIMEEVAQPEQDRVEFRFSTDASSSQMEETDRSHEAAQKQLSPVKLEGKSENQRKLRSRQHSEEQAIAKSKQNFADSLLPSPVLPESRVNHVEGVLQSLNLNPYEAADILKAVALCSESEIIASLSQADLEVLASCIPEDDERYALRRLEDCGGGNDAEEFMLELLGIKYLGKKIQSHIFVSEFMMRANVVQDASNIISRACREIESCGKLHVALGIIHKECLGSSGQKTGTIGDITSLKNLPYSTDKCKMIHFLAKRLADEFESIKIPNIIRDIPSCSTASQLSLEDIRSELQELALGIEQVSVSWNEAEPGYAIIDAKVDEMTAKLSSTNAIVVETDADFIGAVSQLGIDPTRLNRSPDFFHALLDISDALNNAHLENMKFGFTERAQISKKQSQRSSILSDIRSYASASFEERNSMIHDSVVVKKGLTEHTASKATPRVIRAPGISVEKLLESASKSQEKKTEQDARQDQNSEDLDQKQQIRNGDSVDIAAGAGPKMSSPVSKILASSRALIDSIVFDTPVSSKKHNMILSEGPFEVHEDDICEMSSPKSMSEEQNMASHAPGNAQDWDYMPDSDKALVEKEERKEEGKNDKYVRIKDLHSNNCPRLDNQHLIKSDENDNQTLCEDASQDQPLGAVAIRNPDTSMNQVVESSDGSRLSTKEGKNHGKKPSHIAALAEKSQENMRNSKSVAFSPSTKGNHEKSPDANISKDKKKKDIGAIIDLSLASQLMANAEKLKRQRQQPHAAHHLQSDDRAISLEAKDFDMSHEWKLHEIQTDPCEIDNEQDGRESNTESAKQSLTPEQTRAVQALGEIIRKSIPKFSSSSPDQSSGLHMALANLDLDKILSSIIANAGNTPTGPLARGVRGGDEHLFDDEGAKFLREKQKEYSTVPNAHRKALLEPIVPAPLGMGVTVSKTVSHGISPQTLARSLHSNMNSGSSGSSAPKSSTQSVAQRHSSLDVSKQGSINKPGSIINMNKPTNAAAIASAPPSWKNPWSSVDTKQTDGQSSKEKRGPLQQHYIADESTAKDHFKAEHNYDYEIKEEIEEDREDDALPPNVSPLTEPYQPDGGMYTEQDGDVASLDSIGLRLSRDDKLRSSREHSSLAAERIQMWENYRGR